MRTTTVTIMKASQGEYRFSEVSLTVIANIIEGMAVTNIRFEQDGVVKKAWVDEDRTGNPRIRAELEFKV